MKFIVLFLISFSSQAALSADCEYESVQAALVHVIQNWNIDGEAVGTSFKATGVALKPGSEGVQGTFTNIVYLEIFEAGRNSTLKFSLETDMQKFVDKCRAYRVQ